jgi:hypothetical protein
MWDTSQQQLRYLNYIINLVVQDFLFYNMIGVEELKSYNENREFENETKKKF